MRTTTGLVQKAKEVAAHMTLRCTFPTPLPPSTPSSFLPSAAVKMSSSSTPAASGHQQSRNNTTVNNLSSDLELIFKQKKSIRSKVRKALKEMDPSHRDHEDNAIQRTVLESSWFRSSKRMCAYISCKALREVDTSTLLAEILQNTAKDTEEAKPKMLYVPRVEDKNCHMRMLNISSMKDLIANSMDILEPAPIDSEGIPREDVMQASEPVDLFFLPGLAFDRTGRRLGRGGGYYDTFLTSYRDLANERNWKQPLLVALSYSLQILDDGVIPVTPNDVFIDAIVSPTGVIPVSKAARGRMEHDV